MVRNDNTMIRESSYSLYVNVFPVSFPLEILVDKINCTNCHVNLGRYNWNGVKCDCEADIIPGFLLRRSTVDVPLGF